MLVAAPQHNIKAARATDGCLFMDEFISYYIYLEFRQDFLTKKKKDMTLIFQIDMREEEEKNRNVWRNALESVLVSMTVGPRADWPFCRWVCLRLRGRKGSWHQGWQWHSQRTVCLSDRPTSPSEHNQTVMSEPSFAMAASHDSTECGNLHAPCVCCMSACNSIA